MEKFFDVLAELIFVFLLLGGFSRWLKRRSKRRQRENTGQTGHGRSTSQPSSESQAPLTPPEPVPVQSQETVTRLVQSSETGAALRPKQHRKQRSSRQKPRPASLLAFDPQRGYLQGIILAEILGPSVSKRRKR